MDYRCPLCGTNQKKTKFGQSMVTRMEVECSHCRAILRLNVHRVENLVVLLNFAVIVVLAAFAWWLQSRNLVLVAVGAAMAGAAALPLLEQIFLHNWPRYKAAAPGTPP